MSQPNTFKQWMIEVDQRLLDLVGLTSSDLPDQTYRAWFDDGIEPHQITEDMLDLSDL